MAGGTQYLVPWNVPQRINSSKRSPRGVRRNKLVFVFCFSHDHTIDFVVDVDFFQESLADMVKQLVKVAVIVVYVADIRSMVAVLFKDGKGDLWVDTQNVDRDEALVTRLLLSDTK
jgi:hypothetical protein